MTNPSNLVGLQGIYDESEDQLLPAGTRLEFGDGRVYRYAKAGGTLVMGQLMQAEAAVANHVDLVCPTASAVGDTTVHLTLGATALVANDYKDGYFQITDGASEGMSYKIKSHPAADASANVTVTLYDKLHAVVTNADSTVSLVKNPYQDVIQAPATVTGAAVGVTPRAVTDNYWFWLQTKGTCNCLCSDTPAARS
jgi:hypothetical protein